MDRYTFESRESYEKAVKEEELIQQLKKKADLKNNKTGGREERTGYTAA